MSGYKSWCITIRPKGGVGIGSPLEIAFDKWIKKCKGGAYTFEKEGAERHIHAQVFYDEGKLKQNIKKGLIRHVQNENTDPDWSPSSAKVLGGGIRIAYNGNFIENYMAKDLQGGAYPYINIPEDEESYYPSQEEQKTVKEDAQSRNPFMLKIKRIWIAECVGITPTPISVAKFLQRLFVEDRIPYLLNKRSRIEQRDGVLNYILKCKMGDLYMTKEEFSFMLEHGDYDLNNVKKDGLGDLD